MDGHAESDPSEDDQDSPSLLLHPSPPGSARPEHGRDARGGQPDDGQKRPAEGEPRPSEARPRLRGPLANRIHGSLTLAEPSLCR